MAPTQVKRSSKKDGIEGENYLTFLKFILTRRGAYQILLCCTLFSFGFGSMGIVPGITMDRYARLHYGYDEIVSCSSVTHGQERSPACRLGSDKAQSNIAVSMAAQKLLLFVLSPVVGSCSDKYGRKPFMLGGIFFSVLFEFTLVILQMVESLDPAWFFVCNSLNGLIGFHSISLAVMTDLVPPTLRAPSFALVTTCTFAATSIVPSIAVMTDNFTTSVICLVCLILSFILALLYIPETLPQNTKIHNRKSDKNRIIDASSYTTALIQTIIQPIKEMSILNSSKFFRLVSLLALLSGMMGSAERVLVLYYVRGQLNFTDADVAALVLIHAVAALLSNTLLLKSLVSRYGEKTVVIISMILGVILNTFYGVSRRKEIIYLGTAVAGITVVAPMVIPSMMSFNVGEHEQGRIQGVYNSLNALSNALGPISLQAIYLFTKDGSFLGPGSMFFVAAIIYIFCIKFAWELPAESAYSKLKQDHEPLVENIADII